MTFFSLFFGLIKYYWCYYETVTWKLWHSHPIFRAISWSIVFIVDTLIARNRLITFETMYRCNWTEDIICKRQQRSVALLKSTRATTDSKNSLSRTCIKCVFTRTGFHYTYILLLPDRMKNNLDFGQIIDCAICSRPTRASCIRL